MLLALPKSRARSLAVKRARRNLRKSEADLGVYRRSQLSSLQRLAKECLDHRWTRFVFSSPTGGTARGGLRDVYAGRQAHVAAKDWRTPGYKPLLECVIDLADEARGPLLVNCIVNGQHSVDSDHYYFRAVDIDKTSAVTSAEVRRVTTRHGGRYLSEDAYHWHLSWAR